MKRTETVGPWETAGRNGKAAEEYVLRLYVTGATPKSTRAILNIKSICEEHLHGRYALEVIDVYQQPVLARGDQIVAVPTLIKKLPHPLRVFIGDMSHKDKILLGLDVRPRKGGSVMPQYAQSHEQDLAAEVADLRARLAEAEDTLAAIRSGEVDALLVAGAQGEQVFTLQGAETPYRFLVEAMNEGAIQVIPDGTIVYANAQFAGFVRTPLQQVVTSSWQKYFPVSDHPRFEAVLAAGQSSGSRGEFNLQAADGALRPVLLSFAPMAAAGVQGTSIIVTDLAEMKETALALRQTVADMEAFSYSISHDMRTPLRAMQGFSSMLLQSCADRLTQEELDYLRRIVASSSRLDQLIRDVLRYSRTARAELALSKVDVGRLTRQIIESYPTLVEPKAEVVIEGEIPAVLGHEASLSQCISNLLDNAVKFVPPGTLPRVIVSAKTNGGQVRISFADNGIGIEPRHQQRIFKIFERVHPVEKYGGTGIGLSIVKKTVERMGGQVGVESALGKGSTFWIQLPTAREST